MEKNILFKMYTEWVGVDWEEEVYFDFDDDMTEEERKEEIESELKDWVDEKLWEIRVTAEWEEIEE